MNPEEMLKKLKAMIEDAEPDYSSWVQVGVLNAESKALRRQADRDIERFCREGQELEARQRALVAQVDVYSTEYWNKLYKIHCLPGHNNYHLTDDGRILMMPKDKKAE